MNKAQSFSVTMDASISPNELEELVQSAINSYFESCRSRVPAFVKRHFRYPGAWHTNRVAFGLDMIRAPLNLFWAPIYALLSLARYFCKRKGYRQVANILAKCPDGFTTCVQKTLAEKIVTDLLKLDCSHNALAAHITRALRQRFAEDHHNLQQQQEFAERVTSIVDEALVQYRITRTASCDIANSITSTLLGAFAFNKFTPGGIGIGLVIATVLARMSAEKSFFLGETLGRVYYRFFPPEPSLQLTLWSLGGVLVLFAIFASFSGLISDPIQAHLGLHRHRLKRMIDHLEKDFQTESRSSFRPKDQYLARILDVFDALKSHVV